MKVLITYYSLEGNTDYAAGKIADVIGADTLRLRTKKAYRDKGAAKFIWGAKSALMAEKPKLEPYDAALENYDMIVMGFPVWASRITPPLRTFIKENKKVLRSKKIAAFACQSGQGADKALEELKKCIGIDSFAAEAVFIDPKARQTEETDNSIEKFADELKNGTD